MKDRFIKIKNWLLEVDGLWSIPVTVIVFVLTGWGIQMFSGGGEASYSIVSYQAVILAISSIIIFFSAVIAGIWFNQRGLYNYLFKGKATESELIKDFQKLTEWQKVKAALAVFGFILASFMYVFSLLV